MATTYKYGIDFGTTNSSIALHYDEGNRGIRDNHVFKIDLNLVSRELLPSVVYIDAMGEVAVGTKARRKFASDELPDKLKILVKKVKLVLDEEKDDATVIKFGGRLYRVSDIIALILKELNVKADQKHTVKTSGFVFGVPVNYNDACKRVMLEATVKAKFFNNIREAEQNVEFLSEPVAVALDYGLNLNSNKNVFVFDFGGGTLDLAVVRLNKSDDENGKHEVTAKHRITLGGEQYTEDLFKKVFVHKYGRSKLLDAFGYDYTLSVDELWDRLEKDRLGQEFIDEIEKTKCELSYEDEILFQWGGNDTTRNINITCELTREEFNEAISESLNDVRIAIDECLRASRLAKGSIDEVLMAGGSSLIPAVIKLLQNYFGSEIVRNPSNNALTSIVKGLAVKGYQENDKEWIDDVVDSDYGIWLEYEQKIQTIVKKNTKIIKTAVNKGNISEGCYIDLRSINDKIPIVQVFQGTEKIGEFSLPHKGSGKFRIYYEIDKKHGWLTVYIFDRLTMQWYDNILEHNKIKLK